MAIVSLTSQIPKFVHERVAELTVCYFCDIFGVERSCDWKLAHRKEISQLVN